MGDLKRAVFYFPDSDSGGRWEGWWRGERWNGWAVPYFERATMIEILLTMGPVEARQRGGMDGILAVLDDDGGEQWFAPERTLVEYEPEAIAGVAVNVYRATGLCWDVDPEECANCGGSTAPGTPSPHECTACAHPDPTWGVVEVQYHGATEPEVWQRGRCACGATLMRSFDAGEAEVQG